MQELAIEAPPTADPDVLDKLIVDAKAKVGADAITLSDLKLVIDDTTFTGRLSVPRSADGTLELDLAGDSIDIARYMAPASEEAAAEGSGGETVEIPVELIRALNARGNLSIASASLGEILFEKVTLGVNAADGKLRMYPIAADFFDGGYRGDVRIDASGNVPSISVNENIADVSLEPMMKAMYDVENVTGTAHADILFGDGGANTLDGGAGDDDLAGHERAESIGLGHTVDGIVRGDGTAGRGDRADRGFPTPLSSARNRPQGTGGAGPKLQPDGETG